jgi:hypothetical protein
VADGHRAANRVDSDLYIAGLDWEPLKDVHLMPNVEATQYHARGTAVRRRPTTSRRDSPSTTAGANRDPADHSEEDLDEHVSTEGPLGALLIQDSS